ncbi:MAG: AraC family transcriptional regulator [Spirochaetia bacterium]|nr:AraC family transcriptional regulator [Spirochaetia bacterium]
MTIYEQVQRAVDYIEDRLGGRLRAERVARAAGMSVRSLNHWFRAVTGYRYGDYVAKRRLSEALRLLSSTEEGILDIALEVGYGTHESFCRAFKGEFGVAPRECRRGRPELRGAARVELAKEFYMGVIVKDLGELKVASFEGFAPEPEAKAKAALRAWLDSRPQAAAPRRVFGHNIDREGKLACDPVNVGYKFLATLEPGEDSGGARVETIPAGRYAVTGIEGNFDGDPAGAWIGEGWRRMNEMMAAKGFRAKPGGRWFEEELEPAKPGNLRLDLYLELES